VIVTIFGELYLEIGVKLDNNLVGKHVRSCGVKNSRIL